ncbi:OB-fold domain-containing protein [Candidatus Woesearchaeota archaeon]|nr:OB-fold domain-containing protein [Candidatus Woesearchaeota archaeon]
MYLKLAENMRRIRKIDQMVGRKGKIIEFTKITSAPSNFRLQEPYYVALIELENGEKVTAQVVDCENISEGMEVEGILRKLFCEGKQGIIQYGVKFRPEQR